MAYYPHDKAVILFGGNDPVSGYAFSDTWEFSAGSWTQLPLTITPAGRWAASFAYDPALHGLVLFGGRDASKAFNDTWVFRNNTWHPLYSTVSPSPRLGAAMAFDPSRTAIVLYGGGIGNVPIGSGMAWSAFGDTWKLNRSGWTNLTASVTGAPGPRFTSRMVYFPPLGCLVLIGGTNASGGNTSVVQNQTWTLRGTRWAQLILPSQPSQSNMRGELAYDAAIRMAVLFGGQSATSWEINTTWVFTGRVWVNWTSLLPSAPPPRGPSGFAYDAYSHELVVFGGTRNAGSTLDNETWVFR